MRMPFLSTRPRGILALVVALLVVTVGLCVFDHHAGGAGEHGAVVDLCLGMLGVASVVAPLIALAALGWATAFPAPLLLPVLLHVLEPPPKRFPAR